MSFYSLCGSVFPIPNTNTQHPDGENLPACFLNTLCLEAADQRKHGAEILSRRVCTLTD